jgi:hypothetical protein
MKAVGRLIAAVVLTGLTVIAISSRVQAQVWPNEPPGSTVLTDWGFPALTGSGWGGNPSPYKTIVSDGSSLANTPTALQITFPTGFTGGVAPATVGYEHPEVFTTARELYVGLWWKPSNPWQGHNSGVNKVLYLSQYGGVCGSQLQQQVLTMFGVNAPSSAGPFRMRFTNEFMIAPTYNLEPNVNGNLMVGLGVWHQIEIYRKLSTTSSSKDGVLRWWLDGTLAGNYTTVNDSQCPFLGLYLSPTWGGVADVKRETDYFWYNRVRISQPSGSSIANPTSLTVR